MSCNCTGYGIDIPGLTTPTDTTGEKVVCQQGICAAKKDVYDKALADSKKSGYIVGGIAGFVIGAVLLKAFG